MDKQLPPITGFQGSFDNGFRQAFRERRLNLGISLQVLADFLKIHWSTIRKWELGITTACHPRHVARVAKFLAGGFDTQLRILAENGTESDMIARVRQLSSPNRLLIFSPEMEKALLNEIVRILKNTFEHWRNAQNT